MRNLLFYEWGLRTKLKGTDKGWVVKKIKGKRVDAGDNVEFLVDWGSNYVDSWEPEGNLRNAQEQIHQFLNAEPGQLATKGRKRKAPD